MKYLIFLLWYTWDIWSALFRQFFIRWEKVIWISWRKKFEDYKNTIEIVLKRYYKLTPVIINCIGCGVYGDFLSLTKKDYIQSFECNFLVPILWIRYILEKILKQFPDKDKKKLIVNINSHAAHKPFWEGSAYNSMKAAIDMALKVLEKEYRNKWVKVKQFFPPVILTKMVQKMPYLPKKDNILTLEQFIEQVMDYFYK